MIDKKIFIRFSTLSIITIAGLFGAITVINKTFYPSNADTNNCIIFTAEKNRLFVDPCQENNENILSYDCINKATVKTENNNEVEFEFGRLGGPSYSWQKIESGSYFQNTTAIRGITSITLTSANLESCDNKTCRIYYSDSSDISTSGDNCRYKEFTINKNETKKIDFESEKPFFFKFYSLGSNGTTNLTIKSMEIHYECSPDYLESQITYDYEGGTIIGTKGTMKVKVGSNIVLLAIPKQGYKFINWENSSGFVSSNSYYKGVYDASLSAVFEKRNDTWESDHGGTLNKIDDSNYSYGLWPKTLLNNSSDKDLIKNLDTLNLPLDEFIYYKDEDSKIEEYFVASNCLIGDFKEKQSSTFSDGTLAEQDKVYYFKCEPISWDVINSSNNKCVLESNTILDGRDFGKLYGKREAEQTDYKGDVGEAYPNNYKYSQLRSWLNTTFINKAFKLGSKSLCEMEVDNSINQTKTKDNDYVCENTMDKVFLPSYQEVRVKSENKIIKKTSDYAFTQSVYKIYDADETYKGNGSYYLRSPSNDEDAIYIDTVVNNNIEILYAVSISKGTGGIVPRIYVDTTK